MPDFKASKFPKSRNQINHRHTCAMDEIKICFWTQRKFNIVTVVCKTSTKYSHYSLQSKSSYTIQIELWWVCELYTRLFRLSMQKYYNIHCSELYYHEIAEIFQISHAIKQCCTACETWIKFSWLLLPGILLLFWMKCGKPPQIRTYMWYGVFVKVNAC